MNKLNNKGFTLIEVLAVIAIIAIVAVIATPNVLNNINTGKEKSYQIMVSNVVTASKELYEEVYSDKLLNTSSSLYQYNSDGTKSSLIEIKENEIETNLQTLVSNGFLSGTSDNNIINPETNKNIGACAITITRTTSTSSIKVTYKIENSSSNEECPSTDDYKKGVS